MRPRSALTLAGALLLAGFRAGSLGAQAVFQLEGGGNSITGGYGSRVQFWSGAYEGWFGAGYSRGWRVGLFAKRPFGQDTLRAGFDVLPIGFATDIFAGGSYLLTQGVAWRRNRPHFKATLFGGATGAGAGAPFVNTARADKPLGLLVLDYRPTPALLFQSQTVAARRQTFLESASWTSPDLVHTLSVTGGAGSNAPFGAAAWRVATENVDFRAGYTEFAAGFRRADAPLPNIAEPYHENLLLTLRAPRRAMLTLGHQNFRQDDTTSASATRATVDQAVASLTLLGVNVGGGVFQTEYTDGRTLSTFNSINRALPFGTSGTVMFFQTFRRGTLPLRTMQAELRERVTSKLSISQVFSQTGKSISGGLGGQYQNGFTTIAFDYQNYYVPLRAPNPFMRALNLTIRLQLGNSSANIGTAIDPFGRLTYSASGSTYFYLGDFAQGVQPIAIRFERYVIRGFVRDEGGAPIDGAAVAVGGELAITNSRGEFLVRTKGRRGVPLHVSFDDFLAVGSYELVRAPESVVPAEEDRAEPVQVVLRSKAVAQRARPEGSGFGVHPQGAPREPVAALPPTGVPLPPAAAAVQNTATAARCAGARAALQIIARAAAAAAQPKGCCRGRDGWSIIERPLPLKTIRY